MLRIRGAQMDAFRNGADARFVERVVEHLESEYGEQLDAAWPPERVRARVEEGIARARRWGMSGELALAGFVVLLLTLGDRFDEHPRIREILADESLDPDLRAAMLGIRLSAAEWEEVRAMDGAHRPD